jgi:hypothetical protein
MCVGACACACACFHVSGLRKSGFLDFGKRGSHMHTSGGSLEVLWEGGWMILDDIVLH